jgi:phosphate transport system permease protein
VSVDVVVTDDPAVGGASRERKLSAGSDLPYRWIIGALAGVVVVVMGLYFYSIIDQSIPGWKVVGWGFFTGTNWNYGAHQYGALPLIVGTLLTTAIALLLAVPVSVGAALAIVFLVPERARLAMASTVDLLAVIPSIVYGVWGYLVIAPWFDHTAQPWLYKTFNGNFPFNQPGVGYGVMLGSLVLAIMIIPTVTAISRDVLAAVPHELIEGGLSVGATKGQVLRRVAVPSSRPGIIGAIVLGAGRALGETIALVILLGGLNLQHPFPRGLNSTVATIATEIANNFGNLTGAAGFGILCCLAVLLMVIVLTTNLIARLIVRRNLRRLQVT